MQIVEGIKADFRGAWNRAINGSGGSLTKVTAFEWYELKNSLIV